jgi:hypothetical protein
MRAGTEQAVKLAPMPKIRLEASGFHGAEPGENRWIIQTGGIELTVRALVVLSGRVGERHAVGGFSRLEKQR